MIEMRAVISLEEDMKMTEREQEGISGAIEIFCFRLPSSQLMEEHNADLSSSLYVNDTSIV